MNNALTNTAAANTTRSTNRRNIVLATAGAAMAIFFSACQGGDEPSTVEVATPVAVADATPVVEPVELTAAAAAPVVEAAPAVEATTPTSTPAELSPTDNTAPDQFIPASSPDLPCTSYIEVGDEWAMAIEAVDQRFATVAT